MENDVYQQDKKVEQHGHPCEHHPEVAYAAAELRLRWPHGQPLRNLTAGGAFPCANDDRGTDSSLNSSAQEDAVARVGDAVFPVWQVSRCLLDRQGLTSER